MMLAVPLFVVGAAVSLVTSWLLVSSIERIGDRLGMSEAVLGIVAALAADAPEISAAIAALAGHQQRIGAGVVLGSNVFNLAALLGLGAVVAGRIVLHRRVVAIGGAVAMWVAVICALVVTGAVGPAIGLALATTGFALYVLALGTGGKGLRLPLAWAAWLRSAVAEEELELEGAIRPRRGRWPDGAAATVALIVVVFASITMERAASSFGSSFGVPEIITGGLILAAVTSLPNAVAAVYLAHRGRGAAALSTALSSNSLNVIAGLMLPATVVGLGAPSGQAVLVTGWYAGLTLAVLALCWRLRGLSRTAGYAIIAAYGGFTICVVLSGYLVRDATALVISLSAGSAAVLAFALAVGPRRVQLPARPSQRPRNWRRQPSGHIARSTHRLPSLLPGWTARRIWVISMIAAAAVAAVDAATGSRVVLIAFLIVGPCIALLTGRWLPVTVTGTWACCLAVLLGIPDEIWATRTHLIFIGTTALVTAVAIAGAGVIGRASRRNGTRPLR
jgi:cation:H+ antiporter